ncbi:MAG: factor activating pos9 [Watsoniomyces obsoletus]|nr:MAG: factor activating pos9 [Watsoniomyces obsoletus]
MEGKNENNGGYIIDWHIPDLFPKAWLDLVIVLRVDNGILWERLNQRGYKDSKIQENLDAEIMQIILEDAKAAYDDDDDDEFDGDEDGGGDQEMDYEGGRQGKREGRGKKKKKGKRMPMVIELSNDSFEDMDEGVERIEKWIGEWVRNNC